MKKFFKKIIRFFEVDNSEEKIKTIQADQDYFEYLPENKLMRLNYEIGIFKIY